MADKNLEPQVLTTNMMQIIEGFLSKIPGTTPTNPPEVKTVEIEEYYERMRTRSAEESPSFISVINFYLNKADQEAHRSTKGAIVLHLDSENAGKIFKALELKVAEDEDNESMMNACGELCHLMASSLKDKLAGLGYADLLLSVPRNFRNSVFHGVDFSRDQKVKHVFSFFYWKTTAVVVELTLANLPSKR